LIKKTSPKVFLLNLGCPKNEVDGAVMLSYLKEAGFIICPNEKDADILIINTCGFILPAKEESLGEIFKALELKKKFKNKKVVVAGCLAQRYSNDLRNEFGEVDGFVGIGDLKSIVSVCKKVLSDKKAFQLSSLSKTFPQVPHQLSLEKKPYAYLKIADGCDNRCSYCAIPLIRGRFRSRPMGQIINEAKFLANNGVKEINLVAQDTTFYGMDLHKKKRLSELLSRLSEIEKIKWIRLLYTHPAHYSDELISVIASNPKVCKYLDLPLQHISDEILKLMRRKVTKAQVEKLIQKLRERIPHLTLRTSFIVGFPGETKRDFSELLDFVQKIRFEKMGAFPYSKEEDTLASGFSGQVKEKNKQQRLDELMSVQQKIAFEINEKRIGEKEVVLVESKEEEFFCARSQAEAPEVDNLIFLKEKKFEIGEFYCVEIKESWGYDLRGEFDIKRKIKGEKQ
jgi:ribosomal protein S12 methylthiotransferase